MKPRPQLPKSHPVDLTKANSTKPHLRRKPRKSITCEKSSGPQLHRKIEFARELEERNIQLARELAEEIIKVRDTILEDLSKNN